MKHKLKIWILQHACLSKQASGDLISCTDLFLEAVQPNIINK